MPNVRRYAAWITAAFFMVALVRTAGYYLPSFAMIPPSNFEEVKLPFQTAPIFSAIGILLWGIASDFYPARRLFLLAALLTLAVLAAFWPFFGYSASAVEYLAFFFVSGGLICLPLGADGGVVAPASLREAGTGHVVRWKLSWRRIRHDLVDHSDVLLGFLYSRLGRRPSLLVLPRGGHNPCNCSQPPARTAGERNPGGISGTKEARKRFGR